MVRAKQSAEGVMASNSGLVSRVDAAVDAALAEKRLVGGVVLVALDGETVYARAAGMADREAGKPVTPDTIFRYASLTKPIVSAAAMAMLEDGAIGLDDPVTRYLPDFRPKLADGTEPVITLKHLLTHTSGLIYDFMMPPESPYHQTGISNGFDKPGVTMEEELARVAAWPLAFPPGTAWMYGVSTDVLGAVLQKAAGASLPEIVLAKVTGPLGMADTGFVPADPARLATAYKDGQPDPPRMAERDSVPFAVSPLNYAPDRYKDARSFPSGGAGMLGTAPDFLKFLEAVRQGGAPFLKPQSVKRLTENAIGDIPVILAGPGVGFSLGWAILTDPAAAAAATGVPNPRSVGTWSWGGVYGGSWFVDPGQRMSVVILTNTAIEGMAGALTVDVGAAVYG
jgi:CubicO group peptidase (beta-lactamase class C family)